MTETIDPLEYVPPRTLKMSPSVTVPNYHSASMGIIGAEWRQSVVEGKLPFTTFGYAPTDQDIDVLSLVPEHHGQPRRHHTNYVTESDRRGEQVWVWETDRSSIMMDLSPKSNLQVYVAADTPDHAYDLVRDIMLKVPVTDPPEDHVRIGIWNQTPQGPHCDLKRIKVPLWDDIERNYPSTVVSELGKLMVMEQPSNNTSGKIILWHGPPGTGKTTALRAMARQWKDWCTMAYVSDPEKLFADPGYLQAVAANLGDEDGSDTTSGPSWRLVVCEDSDEFLRARGRGEHGSASLMRLLNFSDGILGQGSNTLILITTNEPLEKLHPAVIRPGRCHSQLLFDKFPAKEAASWLDDGTFPQESMTLAELCERRGDHDTTKIENKVESETYGTYL